jgi:RimJ/RimL family protein N-acetyltransferase
VSEIAGDPVIWVQGQRAALGPLRAGLVSRYWEWENEPRSILGYGRQVPDSLENRTEGYGHQVRSSLSQLRFTVYDTQAGPVPEPAGLATLLIDHQVRTAEFLILLAPQARGRGLAGEATLLTLDYGFHITALRMIWLKVLEPNTAGIRAYTTAGFKPAGRLRQSGYWLGQPCDELIMDAIREDYPGSSHFSV